MSDYETVWDRDRSIVRLPDPAIEVVDERFRAMLPFQAVVERLWTGGRWLEGPVWFGDLRSVVFSDIPNDRMLRWTEESGVTTVFRQPSENANGGTRDREGRLITCEHRTRRVTRTEHDGRRTVLADRFEGKPLNAPNDVVVAADGGIWFTDPGWGIEGDFEGDKAEKEIPCQVYRIDPDSLAIEVVVTDMARPNGIAFSPDESLLYVVDKDIRVYDLVDGRPVNGRRFIDMGVGTSDGIRIDTAGNLWTAAAGGAGYDGVHCYDPDGVLLGRIHLPEGCANLAFGGIKKNRLFLTATSSLYSVHVEVHGAQTP
ncbi:SMP-30/gluconolactonase/LRE family protein [Amnibacterium sp.]|uniref:SMP-30/gluconolactonase/LRE family protein n=1 Tax=Amnibacterium sp. TaxID=1872496 RepID=UPI002621521D|nr:SMP-30/gluconolactonase/LRE family protein [Amnibacterium sp.]MCU1471934.1 putative gluconolactonase [Amnibacterium sp.]